MSATLSEVRPPDVDDTSDMGWRVRAACRTADPEVFFPEVLAGQSFQKVTEHVAWRYCAGCPVRALCDDYAERTRSLGLWAGTWRRYRNSEYLRDPVIPSAARAS